MSTFEVKVYKLEILPHSNADNIELVKVGDYVSIVKKGDFKTGDLGVYIPEQALVPESILEEMGLLGRLSGSGKNRVKAVKLRGVLSQGLIYPPMKSWKEGQEVSDILGIKKWEPTIPQHMKGRAIGVGFDITVNYDIENIKKYNGAIKEGEFVAITEKIHGTNVQFGYIPQRLQRSQLHLGCFTVTSKGLGAKGILLDFDDKSNVYTRTVEDPRYGLGYKLPCIKGEYKDIIGDNPIYVVGEIFGPGIQKGFSYGVGGSDTGFKIFDIAYGERSQIRYLDYHLLTRICKDYDLPMVPVLYVGPFTKKILETCTKGKERVSGKQMHMREGCVVRPLIERHDERAGRVVLKSVSEEYLLRKGEVTEYA